jgi:hypothetical protein
VDFGTKVLRCADHLYHSKTGSLDAYSELELVIRDLSDVCQLMAKPMPAGGGRAVTGTGGDAALETLCQGCYDVANKLLSRLKSLKVSSGTPASFSKKWDCFGLAMMSLFKKEEVNQMVQRLSGFREQIQMRITLGFRYFCNRCYHLPEAESYLGKSSISSRHTSQLVLMTLKQVIRTYLLLFSVRRQTSQKASVSSKAIWRTRSRLLNSF